MKKIKSILLFVFCFNLFSFLSFGQETDSIVIYYSKGDIKKAFELSSRSINKSKHDAQSLSMHGRILVDLEKYLEGKPYLEKAIKYDKNKTYISAWSWAYLGHLYFHLSEYSKSKDALQNCLKLNATKTVNSYAKNRMFGFGFDDYFKDWKIIETEHLRFHLQIPSEIPDITEFTSQREKAFCSISNELNVSLPKKIDFFVWNNSEEPKSKFNMILGFANPWFLSVYTHKNQTVGHEMTHVITNFVGNTRIKTQLINEGTAVFFNQSMDNKLLTLKKLMETNGINQVKIKDNWEKFELGNEAVSYALAGAFISDFVEKFGIKGLIKILDNQTYKNAKSIFGNELEVMISEFEKKIQISEKQVSIDTTRNDFITKIILENYRKGLLSLNPMILFDAKEISVSEIQKMNLNAYQIENVSLLDKTKSIPVFGSKGGNGVLMISSKEKKE